MNTKDKILQTALDLFNEKGLSQVTLRTIANQMGISQGNLCYHYNKREQIIESLYFNLAKNIDSKMEKFHQNENLLKSLFDLSEMIMHSFYDFRFLFLDFIQVMRENDTIKEHYKQLTKQREKEFSSILNALIKDRIIQPEVFPKQYFNLYKRWNILGDFWISSAYVQQGKIAKKEIKLYFEIISESIYPYLTDKGKIEYEKLNG